MNILLIDTSQPTVWVGLIREGVVIAEREWTGDKTLGVKLLEAVEEMVATSPDSPLDRIAVHRGPGHFMSVRAGVVTAQVLAQSWGVPLVGVEGQDRSELVRQALGAKAVGVVQIAYD